MWTFLNFLSFAAGYAASIYSWAVIKVWINGLAAEAASLRAKATQLESRIRTL